MKNYKHAFLIITFNNYKVNEYCIRLLDHPNNTIFLSIDKKAKPFNIDNLRSKLRYSKLVVLNEANAYWAGFSLTEVTLKLLSLAKSYSNKFKYYHLFYGADLPIKGNREIHAYFEKNYPIEFIDFAPNKYEFAKYKHNYYHLLVENKYFRTNKFVKYLNHGMAKAQQFLHIKRKNDEQLYHGSGLVSITDRFCDYLLTNIDRINKEYKYTLACDEVLFQTELMNSEFRNMIKHYGEPFMGNARLIEWGNKENKNSPKTFSKNDFDKLINADNNILFARKFVESKDFEIVEMLYDYLTIINKEAGDL